MVDTHLHPLLKKGTLDEGSCTPFQHQENNNYILSIVLTDNKFINYHHPRWFGGLREHKLLKSMLALIAMSINRKRRAVRKVTYFSSKTAPEPTDKSCNICLDIVHSTDSRGRLPVCSHYYCYTCIFEWSKVGVLYNYTSIIAIMALSS